MNVSDAEVQIFTKTAIARVLDVKPSQIKTFVVDDHAVRIQFQDGEQQEVSRQSLIEEFADFRKRSALSLAASVHVRANVYAIYNQKKDTCYLLKATDKEISCQCVDWKTNKGYFGHGICKHSYRLLFDLGFKSLKEYVRSKSVGEVGSVEPEPTKDDGKPMTVANLEKIKMVDLKKLARSLNVKPEGDKRYRRTWIAALSSQTGSLLSMFPARKAA